jgi:putative nucleotidyltransferase with HDIG domain
MEAEPQDPTTAEEQFRSVAASAPDARQRFRELFAQVAEDCDLPPLPEVAARALALTRDPRTSLPDVARLVADDAAIAARVLKMSRSAVYVGRRQPPRTVEEAISTIGMNAVRRVLVAASAHAVHLTGNEVGQALWNHALATALAADELARLSGQPSGGEEFIAGLLHDVGRLVCHLADRTTYATLGHFDEAGEKARYGASHPVVAAALVDRWGLEMTVVKAIIEHHSSPVYPGPGGRLAQADWVAHRIGYGATEGDIPDLEIVDSARVDLDALSERVAEAFEQERAFFS